MNPINMIKGRALPLLTDDIDTDRIIPGRFLRCVTFDGIGEFAFYDERFNSDGFAKRHPMNELKYKGASVILAGKNFGCGSSREHAPQALKRAGFNAVIAESFAEIFFGNSLTIGLLCVTMPKDAIVNICKKTEETPAEEMTVLIGANVAEFAGEKYHFYIPDAARSALLSGSYDLLAELLRNEEKSAAVAKNLPY